MSFEDSRIAKMRSVLKKEGIRYDLQLAPCGEI
jgi:hypothetical protein